MLVIDGYSLTYDKTHNRICIDLPATEQTAISTVEPISKRRVDISDHELGLLLLVARNLFFEEADND